MVEILFYLYFTLCILALSCIFYNNTTNIKKCKSSIEVYPIDVIPIEVYLIEAYLKGKWAGEMLKVSVCIYTQLLP
jgi:hypothetical protein